MELADGQSIEVKGSGSARYALKNAGGVYSCSCPGWRNQSLPIEHRRCKHLNALLGPSSEPARAAEGSGAAAILASRASGAATPPPLLLAHSWDGAADVAGWWMSEKLDGVRAYWDGHRFVSRLGNPYFAPEWFTKDLPAFPLDGELWGGRKLFQRTVSIARRHDRSDVWRELEYVVFDAPAIEAPFEDRLRVARRAIGETLPAFARVHDHEVCEGVDHLRCELARVEALGGEGLMLRRPGSRYEAGRSHTLLKVKSFKDDEARVVAHVAGAGKHAGRVGALVVEMANGTRFNVGTGLSEAERASPAPIGSVVTFRYQELSDRGVPRFPSYVGARHDVAIDGGAR